MKKSTTITDIARELNIDVSTVSKALKNHPKISDTTKKKVQEKARQLNYRPNHIATALVKGKSNLVAVMVPHTDETFFASAIRGIVDVVKNEGYGIIIFQSNNNTEDEISNIETMFRARVDGIIASHAMNTDNFDHYENILKQDIPLVLFDRFNDNIDSDIVAIDDYKGGYKVVTHLIEQGCKKIAHISGNQNVHIYNERFRGYQQALNEHGLPLEPSYVVEGKTSLEDGKRLAARLMDSDPHPDAIFCADDFTALGAIQLLQERGIQVPDQVAVAGFSNEPFTSFVTPGITSVDQHSREMGIIAAQHFLDQMNSQKNSTGRKLPRKTILSPDLIIRDSSLKKR